jgi:hypothetical protein
MCLILTGMWPSQKYKKIGNKIKKRVVILIDQVSPVVWRQGDIHK